MALMLGGCQQTPPAQLVVTQPPASGSTSEKTTTTNTETRQVETPQTLPTQMGVFKPKPSRLLLWSNKRSNSKLYFGGLWNHLVRAASSVHVERGRASLRAKGSSGPRANASDLSRPKIGPASASFARLDHSPQRNVSAFPRCSHLTPGYLDRGLGFYA